MSEDPHKNGRKLPSYRATIERLQCLRRGEAHEYHVDHPNRERCPGRFAAAWDAYERGYVMLVQRRRWDGRVAYLAIGRKGSR